jgi:hypothetical protein
MFTLILVLSSVLQVAESKPRTVPKDEQKVKSKVAATPEQAMRTFLIAMLTKDEPALRAVTLPTDDFQWMLSGEDAPADRVEEFKAQFTRMPIRLLKPGDEIALPGGRKFKVRPEEVTADRAVLLPEAMPIPFRIRKVDARWRVDATPIVAARKAAEAARKKSSRRKR